MDPLWADEVSRPRFHSQSQSGLEGSYLQWILEDEYSTVANGGWSGW